MKKFPIYLTIRIDLIKVTIYFVSLISMGVGSYLWYQKLFSNHDHIETINFNESFPRLVLVYIGSPTCGPSNHPMLPQLLRTMRSHLSSRILRYQIGFHQVGIAIGASPKDGLQHLEKMGPFDELGIGGQWKNLAFRWIRDQVGGATVTPQIVLYWEENHGLRLVLRLVGIDQIRQWVKRSMPLPFLDHRFGDMEQSS